MYWLTATAFMKKEDVFALDRPLFPVDPTLDNLIGFFHNPALLQSLRNSVDRFDRHRSDLGARRRAHGVLAVEVPLPRAATRSCSCSSIGQLIPGALLLISLYLMLSSAGLLYTYTALIISFTTFTLPLTVFLLKGIIDGLPDEILEAAKVDGLSRLKTMFRIVFPLIVPGLITAAMFAFMRGWSDLLFALTLAGPDKQTLPAGLTQAYIHEGTADWPALMAASLITSLPLAIIFILLQRYFVSGLASGAVKG